MWRIGLAMIAGGGYLGWYGFQEFRLGWGSGSTPEPVTAAELEKGVPDNPYRTLGPHVPLYQSVVYMQTTRTEKGTGNKTQTLDYAYYGVTSPENPDLIAYEAAIERLQKKYSDPSKVPAGELPRIPSVRVIVKMKFPSLAALKLAVDKETFPTDKLTGMVVNRIESLKEDEIRLLRQGYAQFDPNTTVIFEGGRSPTSTGAALGMLGGGVVLALLPIAMWFRSRKAE